MYDKVTSLYYLPEDNRFIDCDGNIIHDIYRIVTPTQLSIFKSKKDYCMFQNGLELVYPEDWEE